MSIDDKCPPHYPKRVYIWQLDPEDGRNLYGTCMNCKTDYHIPNDEIVRLCSEPDHPGVEPFHKMFATACALYRLNVKGEK